ncbi:hypothetical protein K402DRAFT_179848 [Aulographum hederae CBS 113979]|uniref:Uncharacterized protein n=1 Tax=Aulographum hederae CBS 113979 TaxID=1176131 RepID=A0A6G1GQH5_9PEZI|nr:hypothetical protein K402DRAFT_179848 [Aulographum hederae CBS 113979]
MPAYSTSDLKFAIRAYQDPNRKISDRKLAQETCETRNRPYCRPESITVHKYLVDSLHQSTSLFSLTKGFPVVN